MKLCISLRALRALIAVGLVPQVLQSQAARVHPGPEFISRSITTNDIAFNAAPQRVPFQRLTQPNAVIGSLDGNAATIFGRITSTEFVDDSTIAVLDASVSEVRLFTISGRHLQTLGRDGSGPGEFRSPALVSRSPAGEIVVADGRRTLQFFRRGTRGFEYSRTWTLPFGIRSMCYLGSRLYINGADLGDGKIIRVVDDSGNVTASFGEIYRSPNRMINYQVAQGRVACDQARDLIYYMAGSLLGEVRAFRPTGELVWRVRITDFLTNRITDGAGGTTKVERSPTGAHAAGNMVLLGSEGLLAQWTFLMPEQMKAKEAPTRIHSILIEPGTGKPVSLGTSLPLITGRRGQVVVELTEDTIPQLQLRSYPTLHSPP